MDNNEQELSKELLESLQEIEDYKKGKIKLQSFKTPEELFNYLNQDKKELASH